MTDDLETQLRESTEIARSLPAPLALAEIRRRRQVEQERRERQLVTDMTDEELTEVHGSPLVGLVKEAIALGQPWMDVLRIAEVRLEPEHPLRCELEEAREEIERLMRRLLDRTKRAFR